MKLRLKKNTMRIRVLRSEMAVLLDEGHIEESVTFSPEPGALLTYVLRHEASLSDVEVRYQPSNIVLAIPSNAVYAWAQTNQVGIYATIPLASAGDLEVIVEKDFACLDLSDADNIDTFPNPQQGALC